MGKGVIFLVLHTYNSHSLTLPLIQPKSPWLLSSPIPMRKFISPFQEMNWACIHVCAVAGGQGGSEGAEGMAED